MLTIASKTRRFKHTPRARSGGVAAFVLFAAPVLMACVALALDIAMISYQTRQMQSACDAAAMAGVVELLDQTPLYSGSLHADISSEEWLAFLRQFDEERAESARMQAQLYASENAVGGQPLQLDPNRANLPDGDLVVGWVDEPQSLGSLMDVWSGDGPINALFVHGNRSERRGNAVSNWFGQLLGLSGVDLETTSRATIDQRVYGFRPNGHVPVPLIPIAIHPLADSRDQLDGGNLLGQMSQPRDDYFVEDRSGTVAVGPDGIYEIVLTIPRDNSSNESANAALVDLHVGASQHSDLDRCIERGYNSKDLQALGGELAFGDGPLELPVINTAFDVPTVNSLLAIRGEKRVWLLGDRPDESRRSSLSGFFAARVISCSVMGDNVEIVIQPCVLATCTALVGNGWPHNPWIGKAMLSN
jgi:hypothetical protein